MTTSLAQSKLRYDAYEPPQVVNRLCRPGNARSTSSDGARDASSRKYSFASDDRPSLDELSRTVTAGDLALASGDIELDILAKV